jgi:translation initiation factor eIF-2B subunit epsilon
LPPSIYYARVNDPRTYQVISQDVIQRKCAPFVVDFTVFNGGFKVSTFNKYISENVKRHISCTISDRCVIGNHTEIGANSLIVNSVIGNNCKMGDNVTILNSIVWDGVEIKKGSKLQSVFVCDKVVIGEDAELNPGVMLDQNVEVKAGAILEENLIASCYAISTDARGYASF